MFLWWISEGNKKAEHNQQKLGRWSSAKSILFHKQMHVSFCSFTVTFYACATNSRRLEESLRQHRWCTDSKTCSLTQTEDGSLGVQSWGMQTCCTKPARSHDLGHVLFLWPFDFFLKPFLPFTLAFFPHFISSKMLSQTENATLHATQHGSVGIKLAKIPWFFHGSRVYYPRLW